MEQACLRFFINADAGIAHFKVQQVLCGGFTQATHADRDRSALGELDRIAYQVAQHLAQSYRIAAHGQAHAWVELQGQAQAFVFGRPLHQLQYAIQHFAQVEAGDFQFQAMGLELGVIEDVIDDAQ